ncbi:hypothetical protein PC128_g12750 [Phytophthora cactorum]|nr:hypothetical protein PC128_g12750 [Phytophthora cactorum]
MPQPGYRPTNQCQLQADFPTVPNTIPPLPLSFILSQLQPMASVEPKEHRKLCCEEGCKSPARALGRCKRHGGSKRCSSPGCDKSVQTRGLCIRHVAHVAKIADVRELHRAMTNAGCTAVDVHAVQQAAKGELI